MNIKLNRPWLYSVLLLANLALLAGCGFRLRGAVELPAGVEQVAIRGADAYSELGLALNQAWREAGVAVSFDAREQHDWLLNIQRNQRSRRALALDSAGRPLEYELSYELGFELRDADGRSRVPAQLISLNRSYRFDPDNVLAMGDEEQRLQRDMLQFTVSQMMRRISIQLKNLPVPPPDAPEPVSDETAR